jgi:NTE family protein
MDIDGEVYWDGGYAGDPTITPLVRECASNDTILVQINPVERAGIPRTARESTNRVNEVSFDATLSGTSCATSGTKDSARRMPS